jgi:membrane dipeptidase
MLDGELSRIELFRNLGVRVIQMTYNVRNLFGDGCLEPGNAGLSSLGRGAVARMNALGVAIDLSHCGARTTAETIAASAKPVLLTHTGCDAVFRHPRNKDDRELRAMAERGGVVGIYLMPYLDGGTGPLTPAMFLAHWEHALNVCGEDHVGIGSDQSVAPIRDTPEYRTSLRKEIEDRIRRGVSAPGESPNRPPFIPEFNAVRRMEKIAAAIKGRGYSDAVVAKTCGGNFDRVLREIWGE